MDSHNIMFIILAVFIAVSSILTVTTRSIIRSATYLLFVLLGTAGLYFLMGYTFLGAVQAMVYAGGIVVLYVFSILLTKGKSDPITKNTRLKNLGALSLSVVGFAFVAAFIYGTRYSAQALVAPDETVLPIKKIGLLMLSTDKGGFLLPFEVVSLLLLACIVGGLIIARKR